MTRPVLISHATERDQLSYIQSVFYDMEHKLADVCMDLKHASPAWQKFMDEKNDKGQYPFIPFHADAFVDQMWIARQLLPQQGHPHSFIDVGCGIGTKVLLARKVLGGLNYFGIEYTLEYLTLAKKLCNDAKFIHGDALKHEYSAYDVIYFYCPLANYKKQQKLERKIMTTAKKGAVVVGNLMKCDPSEWDKHISHRVQHSIMVM